MLWSELALSQFQLWQQLALSMCKPSKNGLYNTHAISRLAQSLQVWFIICCAHRQSTLSYMFVQSGGIQHVSYCNGISHKQEKPVVTATIGDDLHRIQFLSWRTLCVYSASRRVFTFWYYWWGYLPVGAYCSSAWEGSRKRPIFPAYCGQTAAPVAFVSVALACRIRVWKSRGNARPCTWILCASLQRYDFFKPSDHVWEGGTCRLQDFKKEWKPSNWTLVQERWHLVWIGTTTGGT